MKLKVIICLLLTLAGFTSRAQSGFPFDNEIREYKKKDSISMPVKGGILFIGSSSIRLWDDLEQRFATKPVIKRGVGGCTLEQLVDYYTPYILFPYQPKKVFVYAGENDIASGKTGTFVAEEFSKLWTMLQQRLPKAEVYFLAVKPSPSRAKYFAEVKVANERIASFLKGKKNGHFVDVATPILKSSTMQPDSALFKGDYLHLNSKGYDKWQAVLQPLVK